MAAAMKKMQVAARHTKQDNVQPISVSIRIIKGRNLASRDPNGLSDPFAVVTYGVTTAKTKVIKKTLNPEWNEVLKLGSFIPGSTLVHVVIWDWDYLCPRSDFIGQFFLDLSQPEFMAALSSKQETPEMWFPLQDRPNKNDGPVTGDVCIAVSLVTNVSPCSGFLNKKGGLRRNWKRRWFVLYCEENPITKVPSWSLAYYTGQKDFEKGQKPLGAIPLTGASLDAGFNETRMLSSSAPSGSSSSSSSSGGKEDHAFAIHTVLSPSLKSSESVDNIVRGGTDSPTPLTTSSSREIARTSHAKAQLQSLSESVASRVFELRADSRDEYLNWIRQLEPLLPPHFIATASAKSRAKLAPIFGEMLSDILARQRAEGYAELIPVYIADVISRIKKESGTSGIFRIAGPRSDIDTLIETANAGKPIDWGSISNVHTATGFFKEWLRELSEPLLTYELYSEWVSVAESSADGGNLSGYQTLLARLPKDNLQLLKEVIQLCTVVVAQEDVNLMGSKNVAIVLSPNLLWDRSKNLELAFSHLTAHTTLCRDLIENYSVLFETQAVPAGASPMRLRRAQTKDRTMKTVDEARRLFAAYDYDGNGTLDQKEFWAFFSDVCQSSTSPEVAGRLRELGVAQAIRLIDTNGDGEIDKNEFLDFWERLLNGKLLTRSPLHV